ncbi:MAG: D-alanyl-D-alanine carboxypeptidase/D-alanyl-D-alanine-endopeptidase [Rubrivivax sp.]|nr:D-alanyl-D-alanine carboxypeptidase/D-alanyl-D-alanine-endopeptidase [Rubrivivax sp.]
MRVIRPWFAALALTMLAAQAPALARNDALPPAVREALTAAAVPPEALTAIIMPLQGLSRRWERDADRPMQPGSTMKLVTSIVALERLGPNLRGRTELLSSARVENEVLQGDLVLRGGADPELGWPQLLALFNELRDQGVREIAGDILLDRSLFRPARLDVGLAPFDDAPEFYYNVIPDALGLTGHLMGLELKSDAETVSLRTLPRLDGIELRSAFTLVDRRCGEWASGWQPAGVQDDGSRIVIELRGSFPRHCTQRPELQLIDRDRLAAFTLRSLWQRLGGSWQGQLREGQAAPDARLLARRLARPWGEVLRPLNKQSDNALTRLLYLQLGAQALQPPSAAAGTAAPQPLADAASMTTLQAAEAEVRRWLAERRIDSSGFVIDNGSGLSRTERLSARQLALMLKHALEGPNAADLLMSLPTVGVDGTMRLRLKTSPAAGWARLKTGTLRNVVALAGVVHDERRRPSIFVAIINHENASRARPALDALVDWVARGRPAPAVGRMGEP